MNKVRGRGRARPVDSMENPDRWRNIIQSVGEPSILPQLPRAAVEPKKVMAIPPIVAEPAKLPIANEPANAPLTPPVVDENNNLPINPSKKKSPYKLKKIWKKPEEEEDDMCSICDRLDAKVFCKTCSHAWKVSIGEIFFLLIHFIN